MSVDKQTSMRIWIMTMMRSVEFTITFFNDELVTSGAPSAEMVTILFAVTHALASFAFDV